MELITCWYKGVFYTEEFRPIKGYEGMYEVSSFGRVKSLDREIFEHNGKRRLLKGRFLIFGVNNNGYSLVGLCKFCKIKSFTVHKLVAIAFLDHTPDGMVEIIDHLNSIKTDNFYLNLNKTTQRNNTSRYKKSILNGALGVSVTKDKYRSVIKNKGVNYNLGVFDTKEEASQYYQNALTSIENGTKIVVKRKVYTSNFKGVCFHKKSNKWIVQLRFKDKQVKIGCFDNEEKAIEICKKAIIQIEKGEKLTTYKIIKNFTSKYKGVCWCKRREKWRVYGKLNGKIIHVGYFETEIEGKENYDLKFNN